MATITIKDAAGVSQTAALVPDTGNAVPVADALPTVVRESVLPAGAATSAAQTTGNASLASIDGKLPALVSSRVPVRVSVPQVTSVTILALQTAATGTNWAAFASQACSVLDIVNNSGTAIEYRRGATGNAMQILTGTSHLVLGITNANEIDIRRVDQSDTQVSVQAEAITP